MSQPRYAVAEPRTPEYIPPSLWTTSRYKQPGPKDPKISPKILRNLPEPITSFSYINGKHLLASPAALPDYQYLRGILKNIENGPEHIQLLESPTNKHDMTILLTEHMSSTAVDCNKTYICTDISKGKKHMKQTVVHYEPTTGFVTLSGHYCSPMITLYHELIHSCQNLMVSAQSMTREFLREPVQSYSQRGEQLAIEQANKLAEYLGQGQRFSDIRSVAYYRVHDFASPTPQSQEVVKKIQDYRDGRIDWSAMKQDLDALFT